MVKTRLFISPASSWMVARLRWCPNNNMSGVPEHSPGCIGRETVSRMQVKKIKTQHVLSISADATMTAAQHLGAAVLRLDDRDGLLLWIRKAPW